MASALVVAKAQALVSLVTTTDGVIDPDKLQAVVHELLNTNHKSKRDIARQLAIEAEKIQTQQLAEVASAVVLPKSTQQALVNAIRRRHPQVKQFVWQVNPDLLGGFTIRVADTWYDTTLATDLKTIRQQLST